MAVKKAKKKSKLVKKIPTAADAQEREDTLNTLYTVIDELDDKTVSAEIDRVPTGALKCALGGLYCALNLIEQFISASKK